MLLFATLGTSHEHENEYAPLALSRIPNTVGIAPAPNTLNTHIVLLTVVEDSLGLIVTRQLVRTFADIVHNAVAEKTQGPAQDEMAKYGDVTAEQVRNLCMRYPCAIPPARRLRQPLRLNDMMQLKTLAIFAVEQITGKQLAFEPELMTLREAIADIYQVRARLALYAATHG